MFGDDITKMLYALVIDVTETWKFKMLYNKFISAKSALLETKVFPIAYTSDNILLPFIISLYFDISKGK